MRPRIGLLIFFGENTFRNKIMETVEDFIEQSYNNNGKPWKSSRILGLKPSFHVFFICHHFSLVFSTCSESFVPSLPRSCVCWSRCGAVLLCRDLHGAFVLLYSAPICPGPCAVAWNACSRCSVTLFCSFPCLCAGHSKHVSSAASGRCSRVSSSRGFVEGLVCDPPSPVRRRLLARLLRSFSTWFRRVLTLPSLHHDFFQHISLVVEASSPRECPAHFAVHRESVLRSSLSHLPSASHARGTDFLSPSRCLACVAVPT